MVEWRPHRDWCIDRVSGTLSNLEVISMHRTTWALTCIAALGLAPAVLTAADRGIASLAIEPGGVAQVSGLPALDPNAGLLLIEDPPDVPGTSDCVEVCGMDAATGRITTQWSMRERFDATVPIASAGSLREIMSEAAFVSLQPLLPDQVIDAGARRFAGPETVLIFDAAQQRVAILAPALLRRTMPLGQRALACDDDPETGERNVRLLANASDLQAWTHPESHLLLLRVVYPGNDLACTRAEWLVVRPTIR